LKGDKMKIVDERKKAKSVDFADLKPGDCFEAWGELYVKSGTNQQATGLRTGLGRHSMCGIFVTPVNVEVHIVN